MPRLGRLAASAVRTAGITGGRVADVFDGLALLATEEVDLIRERRAATAQSRFSAWIVGGIPVVYLVWPVLPDGWRSFILPAQSGWHCSVWALFC